MEDKELDQMLKKALTPSIKDDETKVRFEMEDCVMNKKRNFIKPAVALAVCVALVVGISYGNVAEKIMNTHIFSTDFKNSATKKNDTDKNNFTITVKAAEVEKLEKGKETVVISQEMSDSDGWRGTNDSANLIGYQIQSPIVCEGKQIDNVTYFINHGNFLVVQPEGKQYVLDGTECIGAQAKDYGGVAIELEENLKTKMAEKSYSSFTISAKDQKKVYVYLCDRKNASDSLYDKVFNTDGSNEKNLDTIVQGKNQVLDNLVMTCKITYKDGTSEKADVAVKKKVMTYKEAYSGRNIKLNKEVENQKNEFTTFELQ